MSARPAAPAAPARLAALTRQLLTTLRAERLAHDQVLALIDAERAAIAAPTVALADGATPLEEIVAAKERVVAHLGDLEETRAAVGGALATALGLPRETRLAGLLAHLHPSVAAVLAAERAALLARTEALAEANAATAHLLHAALSTTRATIGYLRGLHGAIYDSDGRALDPAPPHRLDRHA